MDANSYLVLVGVISAAVSGFVTVIATKGIDGWIKLRADKRIDETREEKSANEVLMFTITRQDSRIEKLENELRAVHSDHNDCERKYAALSARLDRTDAAVKTVCDQTKAATEETKQALRQAVHDVRDSTQGIAGAAALNALQDSGIHKRD